MSASDPADRPDRRPASVIERLRALFGISQGSIRDDIEDALDETEEAGTESGTGAFTPQERAMLRNVLNLHDLRVEDVMVPRADVIAVSEALTLGEVLKVFQTAGHSRLPVHGGTLDDARGMVHIRDFVALLAASSLSADGAEVAAPDPADLGKALWSQTLKAAGLVRTVLFVPPSMQALDLLVRMQAFRTHMALVIDEYGGTDGLVSIEDIVEEIVGDIEDEHDEGEGAKVVQALDGSFMADGRASLEEVSKAIGIDLVPDEEESAVETLGGLVGALAGHVPGRGEVVRAREDVTFEVLDADPRRVKRVRIIRTAPSPTEGASSEPGGEGGAVTAPPLD